LGGFVKMTGENPGEEAVNDPAAFTSHPRWQRMLIGVAGPAANFVLAFVLMIIYFGWINEVPAYEVRTTTVEWVVPGSAAAQAGIQPGDLIRHFDNVDNPTWEQVFTRMTLDPNMTVPVAVERGGQTVQLALAIPAELKGDDLVGMLPQYMPSPIGVQEVMPDNPAAKAGLRAGDAIVTVDGHPFHTVSTLLAYMQAGQGKPLTLVVERNGALLPPMTATPAKLDTGYKLGFATVPIPFRHDPLPLAKAATKSRVFCSDGSLLIVQMLERIFTHKVAVSQLSGPVGIARVAGEAAEMKGWYSKFYLAGEISLNLGILNLLPFPILDGGMILLLLIESVIRRDISTNVKERIYQAAFVVLMVFFAFIIFNDVTKLPIFNHLKP
jgi:regulator of sigma E protease